MFKNRHAFMGNDYTKLLMSTHWVNNNGRDRSPNDLLWSPFGAFGKRALQCCYKNRSVWVIIKVPLEGR